MIAIGPARRASASADRRDDDDDILSLALGFSPKLWLGKLACQSMDRRTDRATKRRTGRQTHTHKAAYRTSHLISRRVFDLIWQFPRRWLESLVCLLCGFSRVVAFDGIIQRRFGLQFAIGIGFAFGLTQ